MPVRVRRWSVRVRAPRERASEPWRAWSERLIRGPVGQRLLAEVLAALTREGVLPAGAAPGPDSILLLRRLEVRVRLAGEVTDARAAEGWARGLATSTIRALASAEARPGGLVGEEAAWFEDAVAAEGSALGQRLAPEGEEPWWVERLIEARSAAEVLAGWIERAPTRAAEAILRLTGGRPAALARLVDGPTAEALNEALIARWAGRPASVVPRPPPAGSSVEPAHLALLLACESHRPPDPIAASPAEPAPTDAVAPAPGAVGVALDLGGVAMLIRPLSRHPLLGEVPWTDWPGVWAGIVGGIEAILYEGLEPSVVDQLREAHAPLAELLTTTWPPPEPTVEPAQVVRALREVLGDLADPPTPVPVGGDRLATVLERRRPPPWDLLQTVALRPATLRLTPSHADLVFPIEHVDLALRRAGWDLDPGFVPGLRRVVRLHYADSK